MIPIGYVNAVTPGLVGNWSFVNLLAEQLSHTKLAAGDVIKGFSQQSAVHGFVGNMFFVGDTT